MPQAALPVLRQRQVFTDEDFWNQLAADSAFVAGLPLANPIDRDDLVNAMAAHSVASATGMTSSRLLDHVPDLLIAAAAVALVIGLFARR